MEFLSFDGVMNLLTLTLLEIILGIDNVIFIALLVEKLERKERSKARLIGISLALIMRILMLFGASSLMKLIHPLFSVFGYGVSGRTLLLVLGGAFLVFKALHEIFEMLRQDPEKQDKNDVEKVKYFRIVSQIIFIDIILSFDSIITAVGISNHLPTMVCAVVISMIIMLVSAEPISKFIYVNPTLKVIALAFIGFLGVILVLAGFDIEINKGYLYFSMLFALIVEIINLKLKKSIKH